MRNMLELSLKNTQSLSMRLERQRAHWNKVVQDKRAFVPWEHKDISEEEAEKENRCFGEFASEYMSEELAMYKRVEDKPCYPRIVSVGWGRGYDYGWLSQAISSRFHTSIVDVGDVACSWAEVVTESKWKNVEHDYFTHPSFKPKVMGAEIRSALFNPVSCLGLELGDVAIWYMSRILGCLPSKSAAKDVLQSMGQSLEQNDRDKSNKIVLISALRDENLERVGRTSKLYSRRMILRNISEGAGRSVVPYRESTYRYFGQVYTAMTIVS